MKKIGEGNYNRQFYYEEKTKYFYNYVDINENKGYYIPINYCPLLVKWLGLV